MHVYKREKTERKIESKETEIFYQQWKMEEKGLWLVTKPKVVQNKNKEGEQSWKEMGECEFAKLGNASAKPPGGLTILRCL